MKGLECQLLLKVGMEQRYCVLYFVQTVKLTLFRGGDLSCFPFRPTYAGERTFLLCDVRTGRQCRHAFGERPTKYYNIFYRILVHYIIITNQIMPLIFDDSFLQDPSCSSRRYN